MTAGGSCGSRDPASDLRRIRCCCGGSSCVGSCAAVDEVVVDCMEALCRRCWRTGVVLGLWLSDDLGERTESIVNEDFLCNRVSPTLWENKEQSETIK